ncbi:MAG: hypothetical protein ACE5FI_19020 [Anaerolineales bacterium]
MAEQQLNRAALRVVQDAHPELNPDYIEVTVERDLIWAYVPEFGWVLEIDALTEEYMLANEGRMWKAHERG